MLTRSMGALLALLFLLSPLSPASAGRLKVKAKPKVKARVGVEAKVRARSWTRADGTVMTRDAAGKLTQVRPGDQPFTGRASKTAGPSSRVTSTWTTKGGVTKQRLADGSLVEIQPNGSRVRTFTNGRRITTLPDGTAVSVNALGQQVVRTADGRLVSLNSGAKPKLPADPVSPGTPRWTSRHTAAALVGAGGGYLAAKGLTSLGDEPGAENGSGSGFPPGNSSGPHWPPPHLRDPIPGPGGGGDVPCFDDLIVQGDRQVRTRRDQDQDQDQSGK